MDLQVFTNNNFSVIQQQVEKSKKSGSFPLLENSRHIISDCQLCVIRLLRLKD